MSDRAWIPAWARDKIDLWLDDDNALEFIRWKDDPEPYQAQWFHRPAQGPGRHGTGWCLGAFTWRNPDPVAIGPIGLWTLISMDPLTVAPSLLCHACQAHGFIENGRWRPV